MNSTEIRLTLVFKPGYDGDSSTVNIEDVVNLAEEIIKDAAFELDFYGYRVEQADTFEHMSFEPLYATTGEISPDEEATDDHANHQELENQSTQQELQPQ